VLLGPFVAWTVYSRDRIISADEELVVAAINKWEPDILNRMSEDDPPDPVPYLSFTNASVFRGVPDVYEFERAIWVDGRKYVVGTVTGTLDRNTKIADMTFTFAEGGGTMETRRKLLGPDGQFELLDEPGGGGGAPAAAVASEPPEPSEASEPSEGAAVPGPSEVAAAADAPETSDAEPAGGGQTLSGGWSGPGYYLSAFKVLACWLVFLAWVATTDWVNRDAQAKRLDYLRWNPIVFGTFMGAFILVWLIPIFFVSFPLLLLALVVPFTSYVVYRNKQVEKHEKVFTQDHIRHWLAQRLSGAGVRIETEKKDPREVGPPVKLAAQGSATERDDRANLLAARQLPGFNTARVVIADGLSRRAEAVMLDYTQQGVGIRYMIDGVWHNGEPLERETGDPMLEALKTLCGLNWEDRQSRQQGTFGVEFESANFATTLVSQGTKTGERAVMQFAGKKTRFDSFDELGMRPKMQEQLREVLSADKGFVLLSAMPGAGLRSTTNVVLRSMDRLTRDFIAVEEEKRRYEEVENIKVVTYKAAEGQTPDSVLKKVFHEEPEVVIVRDLVNGETAGRLSHEIATVGRLVLGTVRAKEAAEALLRVLAMKPRPAEFPEQVQAVLAQRLVRKLCEHCKEAYIPTPHVLQQLGIPEGRVDVFYRPPQHPEQVCEVCSGIGYFGRTAVFELLLVDDGVRTALASTPKVDLVRQAARKAGMRTMQEEGVVLVAKGVTSLPELMRVLKQ
jgi:type II secretory ATPase GspE/PulE/Tfp pilus assembly ATPase PilB-like protein